MADPSDASDASDALTSGWFGENPDPTGERARDRAAREAFTRPLNSSNVSYYRYDPSASTLDVAFKSGAIYRYDDVPPSVAAGLGSAPSPGRYVKKVLAPSYQARRLQ